MPTKDRLARAAQRNTRAKYSKRFETPDFEAPIGKWKSDAVIGKFIDSGKFKADSTSPDRHRKHVFIRGILLGAAFNAFRAAEAKRFLAAGVDKRKAKNDELIELKRRLEAFASAQAAFLEDAKMFNGKNDWASSFPNVIAGKRANELSKQLEQLIEPASPPRKGVGNSEPLSKYFIDEMRVAWAFLTRGRYSKRGGSLLTELAAGIWLDAGFERRSGDGDRPLEDWLGDRFKKDPLWP